MDYYHFLIYFFILFFSIKIIFEKKISFIESFTICFIATILCYLLNVDYNINTTIYYGGFQKKKLSNKVKVMYFTKNGEILIK